MKRKILTILVSMLFITMIPSVIGKNANPESDDSEPCLDVGRVWLRCFVFFPQYNENNLTFFKIRFVYLDISNPQPKVYWFKWITITEITITENSTAFCFRHIGISKNIGYIIGGISPSDLIIH